MSKGRILVAADSPENATLLNELFSSAGYSVILAEASVTPPPVDILVADITRTRFSPFTEIQTQRRLGCSAPAIVFAARITDGMATEAFSLNIRDFVLKPVDDAMTLERVGAFASAMQETQVTRENDRTVEQTNAALTRRLEEMNMLSRIGRAIAALSDLDMMLAHVVDAATFLSHAEEGAIFLTDESGGLILRAEKGFGTKQAEVIKRPSKDSDAVGVLRTGQPIMRGADTEHKLITGFLVRALINVPIIIGKQTVGVLGVYSHGTKSFDESDLAVLINLADYAAMAIDKVRALIGVEEQMREALVASREVIMHAQTFSAPVEGIESLADTLLQGGFGPLNEQQYTAVRRIQLATVRLNEVVEFINQAAAGAAALKPTK